MPADANRMFLLVFIIDLLPKGLFDRVVNPAGALLWGARQQRRKLCQAFWLATT